jgi:hypothetical protein
MNKIILFAFICINLNVRAQTSFFRNFKQPSHERAFSAVQLPDGNFIIVGEKSESGYNGSKEGYIAKLSINGEILKEVKINPNSSARMCLIMPYSTDYGEFLCIGSSDSVVGNGSYGHRIFYTLDGELNIINHRNYSFINNYSLYPWKYIVKNDSILYLMTDFSDINPNSGKPALIDVVKYNLPFDSLGSYADTNLSVTQDLYFNVSTNELNLYIFPSHRKIQLDENLNYISSGSYSDKFPTNICITPINDTNYLLTGGSYNTSSSNLQIGCIHYNNNDIALDSLFYTPSTDSNFYAGGRENTVINGNHIYIAGFYNVNAMWFPYNYNPSWVSVTKADMDLNMISTHFYGGDAQYCPFSIIPTSDGGCFITGYSYDYINNLPNGNLELDIFALKVDSAGLITELPEQPQDKSHDAIIYPNPGTDYLNIQSGPQITGAEFYLFDMQGKLVLDEKINNTQLKVNTANLASGTYPWNIVFKNKVIESGKWVKN